MRQRWHWFFLLFLCVSLIVPIGVVQGANAEPPEPKFMGVVTPQGDASVSQLPPPSNDTTPGAWFVGATPPNADPSKPPIVFVQGMNGRAQDWWDETEYHGLNDMYEKAYQNGYRTAFVQLYDAAGNGSQTPWENGRLLAGQLQAIYNHFGQKVNIVAHSKGGPDSQAALIHYGAHPYVGRVVTLGSPHHGSHLADLAYSWWAGWLADLLGQQSPGTYSLQTGEMAKYRQQTDSHANTGKNRYYTAAGTDWGPFPSALYTGGLYLSQHGDNDGLVNVWSTNLPYGTHLFTIDVDHDAIRTGSVSFGRIESVLRSTSLAQTASSHETVQALDDVQAEHDTYVHGGPLAQGETVVQDVMIQEGTTEGVFNVLTKSNNVKVKLVSPSGKVYDSSSREYGSSVDKNFFAGATNQSFRVANPESGVWKLSISSPSKDAYLLLASFQGAPSVQADLPAKTKGKEVPFSLKLKGKQQLNPASLQAEVKVVGPDGQKLSPASVQKSAGANHDFKGQIKASKSGTYNVTIEIKGQTKDGKPFARTIVKSVNLGQ